MWNALRADFKEFVSTVADDTSKVLTKLDAGMDNDGDTGGDEDETNDNEDLNTSGDDDDGDDNNDVVVDTAELKEIMKLLRDHPGTYLEDLADEENESEQVEAFLRDFAIEAKTDEIAHILETHPDTVKKHFEELCPTQVSYEDFWKRCFYRCNEERIARQLQEETERAREARAEAIEHGIKTVTNFFGGAVKAVTSTIAPEAGANDGKGSDSAGEKSSGLNFFGAKGRPPFVMNTAMDESGEDDDPQEEDEEELGWDDDDDDSILEENSKADTATEQIEFTDKVSEDLQERLKQAIEERDQIQQTVHMQAAEIKALQTKLVGGSIDSAGESGGGELEEMQLKLFEKDAELAALKARVHDDHMEHGGDKVPSLVRELRKLPSDQLAKLKTEVFGMDDAKGDNGDSEKVSALEKHVQQLTQDLAAKETSLADIGKKLESTLLELEMSRSQLSSDQATAQNASTAVKELESKLQSAQAENESLQQARTEASAQLSSLKQDHAESQQLVASVTTQLEETKRRLQQAEDSLKQTDTELAAAKQARVSPSTPDSSSTGVKVGATAFTTPLTAPNDDSAEDDVDVADDWGDDWD